jgi:hypothetical protein
MDFGHVDVTSASTAVTIVASGIATDKSDTTTVATDVATAMSDSATAVTDASTASASTATKWSGYPQNLFGNWTPDQVQRSQMLIKCSKNQSSIIHWIDVLDDGKFTTPNMTMTTTKDSEDDFWNMLQGEASLIRPLHISLDIT